MRASLTLETEIGPLTVTEFDGAIAALDWGARATAPEKSPLLTEAASPGSWRAYRRATREACAITAAKSSVAAVLFCTTYRGAVAALGSMNPSNAALVSL